MVFYNTLMAYFGLSFLFSCSEAAKFALRSTETLSPLARGFVEDDRKSLAALVLGNNKANILIGQMLGQMVGDHVWEWLQGGPWAVLMLVLTVVLGEYVPKAVGEARPAQMLNLFAPVLVVDAWLMAPFIWLLSLLNKWLPKPQVNEDEEELVSAAMQLDTTPVSQIMGKIEEGGPDISEWPAIIVSTPGDTAMRILHDEGPQRVLDQRGLLVGYLDKNVAFEWMFDHLD